MKFLDLFAGIGGFRLGMEQAGHECVGFCEIDKFARASYKAIHNTEGEVEMHDITSISDEFIRGIGDIDIICGGFPCQAFSIAGKRQGFEDTRGTLFFEIARFASILRPRFLFLENVKGLLNHEGGATFETILRALDELGYDAEWEVHNSKDYVPQNRERVFIIGHLRGERTEQVFPFERIYRTIVELQGQQAYANTLTTRIEAQGTGTYVAERKQHEEKIAIPVLTPDRLEKRQKGRRFKSDGEEMFTLTAQDRHGVMIVGGLYTNNSEKFSRGVLPGLSRTLKSQNHDAAILIKEATAQGYAQALPGDSINISHPNSETRRGRVGKGIANTLLTGKEQAVVTEEFQIRKLTPRECWRLQGFPDWAFDRAKEVNSDSQLYKQAGNSVTVPVIHDIARRLVSYPTK
ncbi:DNA (cytosine-5-)-methyltransferase [Enterococcus casseliflavus]|uniref:DNA (cytosine-5-)-methyltransferase n=1 Tax=Enterococcus casseliflavus TaxID=37734 RepID=UPI0012E1FE2A|nr:DNA (cytosine-5-)-methyltransferase [Enterococcus casseliflavus]MUN75674.1 DNA (cytosine-5-)-methyltransferase [Enterococcus casseliflavus]MUN97971.1 DNA (cytosine-5-)-methyltransferase [Enterococcus casseliflavus]